MLRLSHVNAAISIATKLDNMGYRLLPVVNTPLSSLNSDLGVLVANSGAEYVPVAQDYVAAANAPTPGQDISVFTANMENTARVIARFVQSHLSFAKNVVSPLITELVNDFTEKVNSINISPSNDFIIEKYDLPAPMFNTDVKDMIDDYNDITVYGSNTVFSNAPELSIVEIIELMKTGNKKADEAIDVWVATKGEAFFMECYNYTFGAVKPKRILADSDKVNYNLWLLLTASKLHNKPWADCGISLVDYNVAMAALRDGAGSYLSQEYKVLQNLVKTQTLVKTSFGNKITVVKPVYDQWIEDGGNDVVLFAILITGRRLNFLNEITAVRPELHKSWELYVAMQANTERNRKYTIMKKTLYDCVFGLIEKNANPVFSHLRSEGDLTDHIQMQEYRVFKQKFEEYYNTLTEAHFVDIWDTAKHIVCKQIFYYTDAGDILTGIEDACKTNPDMEVSEAALLSTIAYVTKYVCNQMTITPLR